MLKKIIDSAGSLTITMYLLAGVILAFGIGALYASLDYAFFETMNSMRIQDWFSRFGTGSLIMSWWIIAIFILFAMLGLNGIACVIQRIAKLWPARNNHSLKVFMVLISPTLIHLVFILMLAGHLLTFTGFRMTNIPISDGSDLRLPDGTRVQIESIRHHYFDASSLLKERVRQTDVTASYNSAGENKKLQINFLKPVWLNGYFLHLDMKKVRMPNRPEITHPLDETCNKERHFHKELLPGAELPQLSMIITFDPGIYIIIPGFMIVIILLVFYACNVYGDKNEKI